MTERALASIRKIANIAAIPNADFICAYQVDGWFIVDTVDKYNIDDLVVMCEVDSWVPNDLAPFLTKPGHEPKEFKGVKGERLRTIKLRGQLSQGLLLPLDYVVSNTDEYEYFGTAGTVSFSFNIGTDVTEILGILKYEKPEPAVLAGMAKGNFPAFIPKTDQPRVQNIGRNIEVWDRQEVDFEITEKLDGSSMTVYVRFDQPVDEFSIGITSGVCSRNLELKFDETNAFWQACNDQRLIDKIIASGQSLAIQGELIGEGIQGNPYKLKGRKFFCYDIWDIVTQTYLMPAERQDFCARFDIPHVPTIATRASLNTVSVMLSNADGVSQVGNCAREGFVYKSNQKHDDSFKVISNAWLLKNE